MMRRIAVMNQKGGVGKTTTTLNVAHALALAGARVTVLDMDPQGHMATGFGLAEEEIDGALDDVLLDNAPIEEAVYPVRDNLRLSPARPRLAEVELVTTGGAQRGWYLRNALEGKMAGEHYLLVDCPPSAGLLSMNALLAVDEVVIPVSSDYLALQGLSRFVQILRHIEEALGRKLRIWVALTRFQERRKLARDIRAKLVEYFPGSVLQTAVRESVGLAESPSFGKTIFDYQRSGNGAGDYAGLAQDLAQARTL